jgi:hypothetical protein
MSTGPYMDPNGEVRGVTRHNWLLRTMRPSGSGGRKLFASPEREDVGRAYKHRGNSGPRLCRGGH